MEDQQMIEPGGGGETPAQLDTQQTPGGPPPPPSPLSGCYLLIVIGEPHSPEHKEIILQKIAKGFLSWDSETSHVDLEKELQALTSQAPEGEEARNGERLIQYATENLVTEVLIHPQVNTLLQCVRNLLSSFTRHRHLIHAGYTCAGNGSWILQDGTFSLADFTDAFVEPEVQRVLRAYENCVTVDVHCSPEGDWATERITKEPFARSCKVRVNPDDRLTAGGTPIGNFINYINPFLRPASLEQLLEPSDVVGNIRFSHPTLYVFPGGQGDAALFGINGFNMLVDGGFARKACFWDFARHLDRLDAVLMTRLNNGNVNGISAVLRRKKQTHVYPQIGHFFCNLQERRHATSPDGDKDRDALLVDLMDEGQEIVLNLRHLQLRPHPCYRDGNHVEPVNLYHKVGHGKLDMYIISPVKDSREIKEFLSKWNANDPRLFVGRKDGANLKDFHFPLQNLVSICALLVWQPANPNDTITRILFPGSTPQHKIFEGLDKLKHLEFLKHPVCTARSISPSASTVGITSRASSKQRSTPAVIDKLLPGEGVKASSKTIGSTMETNKQAIKTATIPVAGNLPDVKQTKPATTAAPTSAPVPLPSKALPQTKQKVDKLTSKTEPPKMKTELNKSLEVDKISAKTEKAMKMTVTDTTKSKVDSKPKTEPRTSISKSRTDSKPPRSAERKSHKPPVEKKSESAKSSPTTPKKSVEGKMNGAASKAETAKLTRMSSKSRPSPTATPAKSTKEANNRKVVESKYQHVSRMSSTPRTSTAKTTRKEQQETPTTTKTERKPISRRPKPGSPSKIAASGKSPGSPAKSSSAKSTPTPSVKSDKDGVIRKVKGEADRITTDSSAVSTPSTVEPETAALKLKATEVPEATAEISEPDKLREGKGEEDPMKKEIEAGLGKEPEPICEKLQTATDKVPVDEEQVQEEVSEIESQPEKDKLPPEEKHEEESPTAEAKTEQEGEEDEETEDKESEVAAEEIQQEKPAEKEDIDAMEEEKTEDVEEEERGEEQHIETKKSLADELEFEAKHHKEIKADEEEEDEDEEDEYLIIEKEEVEQYMEDSLQEQESVESHVPEELEAKETQNEEEEDEREFQKHLRDEVESEKERKHEIEKDIIKVNGIHEEAKDITKKEEVEDIKENIEGLLTKVIEEETDEKPDEKSTDVTVPEKEQELKTTEEEKKQEEALTKEVAAEIVPSKKQDEVTISKEMTAENKEQLQEEVQEIISSAEEIATKTKRESEAKFDGIGEGMLEEQKDIEEITTEEKKDAEEGDEVKEASSISPEEKLDISSEKNREITDDTRDTDQKLDEEEGAGIKATDQRYPAEESQPDERFSTTVESAATTAPTLPEDERIPLDEIKEIVEEKYVKEETKEEKPSVATIVPPRLEQPTTLPQVVVAAGVGMFDPMAPHAIVHLQRDIVKTPDEVADLPVHEEVDPGTYESDEFSRDYKSKDDVAKKQTSQQELEDSRQQSPEFDIKGELQLKYDDNIEKPPPFQDSKFVDEETAQLPVADKKEPKETIETEPKKKTEKAEEPEAPNIDISKDEDKIETIEKGHDVKEEKDIEDKIETIEKGHDVKEEKDIEVTKELKDEKETEPHKITKDDVEIEDTDKLLATTEVIPEFDVVDKDKKTEVKVVPEQPSEKIVEPDTEIVKIEGPLEDVKVSSMLSVKGGPEEIVKQAISDETKETDKQISEEPISHQEDIKEEQDVSEFKPIAEASKEEEHRLDSKDKIKQITEQFIEKESHATKVETLPADKQDEKPGVCESTKEAITKPESDKLELEAIAVEKTDLEKPVPEKSKEEDQSLEGLAVGTSEAEKFELEFMELNKIGKEHEISEKEVIKTEPIKYPEEKDESEEVFPDALGAEKVFVAEKQLLPEATSEESIMEATPGQEKIDAQNAQFEDEKLEKEEKESEKLDKEKAVIEESRTEKGEEFITKPEEFSKPASIADDSEHSEVEKHDVTKESKIQVESSEREPQTEAIKIDIIDSGETTLAGHAEPEIKDETIAVKELTKEAAAADEEKEIDEKDKTTKDLSLASDTTEEFETNISKSKVEAPKHTDVDEPVTEVPNLTAKEETEDKPSPSALSMTYLEIIDKLQKESQKTDDSTIHLAAEPPSLPDGKQDVSEVQPREEEPADIVSSTLSQDDHKTDEKPESIADIHIPKGDDMKNTDSVQKTEEVEFEKYVGEPKQEATKIADSVPKTDEVDSDEAVDGQTMITTGHLKDTKDITESMPSQQKEEEVDAEAKIESTPEILSDKSSKQEVIETKSDQMPSGSELLTESTTNDQLPQITNKESKDLLKGDTQRVAEDESVEVVEKSKADVDETGLQAELKLTDDKDDSYGDGSISPGEAYVDSGLEEEPVYVKLEAPEVPEYVTVTPDSAPPSPKSQKDQKSPPRTQKDVLEQEPLAAVKAELEGEKVDSQESILKEESITLHKDFTEAKHELPIVDLISDKHDKTTDVKEKALASVADVGKEEVQTVAGITDMPTQFPVITKEREITILSSSDQPEEEVTSSTLKMQETDEANVLEDLVSASKSAIAEIESKLSTQVEEILTASRKEKDETKSQSKSEIYSFDGKSSSVDKDLTEASRLSDEEVIKPTEDTQVKGEAKSFPTHVTEKVETAIKSYEEEKEEDETTSILKGEDTFLKEHGSPEKKEEPTDKKSSTALHNGDVTLTTHTSEMSTSHTKETPITDHDTEKSTTVKEISLSESSTTKEVPHRVTSETDMSKTMEKEVIDTTSEEKPTVTTTEETTVVTSKTTTASSSDSTCAATSSITEITSAEAIAEKETSAIITSTIATVSAAEKEKEISDSGDLTSSTIVRRMVVTASSEDGGTELELCPSGSIIFTGSTSNGESATSEDKQELPGTSVSSSTSTQSTVVTSTDPLDKSSPAQAIKEDADKVTKESISKEDKSKTSGIVTMAGTTNGDVHTVDHEYDDSDSDGEGSSKVVTTKTTKTTTTVTKKLTEVDVDDEIEPDDRDNVEEITTHEIGEDGKIITKTVKTTRTFITVEGEESGDSDFEDEDNIESTAAEDGSDSSRISKTTTSFTTVTKRDDNGARSLSTDSSDKTGDVDSEIVTKITSTTITTADRTLSGDGADETMTSTGIKSLSTDSSDKAGDVGSESLTKTTTTTITVARTLSGDEADETVTTTTTTKEVTLEDGTIMKSTTQNISKDTDVPSAKEEVSRPSSTDSGKLLELSKESSPLKLTTTNGSHDVTIESDSVNKVETRVSSIADGTEEGEKKTEYVGSKDEEKIAMNGKESDKELKTTDFTSIMGKSVTGDLDESSPASVIKEAPSSTYELMRSGTPGSDAMSDRDMDIGCGPSTPHSDISSGQVSRAATNVWGSSEGRPDSQHCDSDEDDDEDEPGSPLSVTSQLAHSPPSHFDFEMGDRNASDYDAKHSLDTSIKHKEEVPSSMTSSFYGSLPPDPLQELLKEQKEKEAHMSSSHISESPAKYCRDMSGKDSIMTSSFYGSLEEDKKGTDPKSVERLGEQLQEDEPLDFERAMYEHRAARGKDLTSTGPSYHYESTSSPSHTTKKYEHFYTSGVNGQKQKDEHRFQEFTEDYGNGNVAAGKQYEDLMNQNREIKEDKYNGKTVAGFVDPLDSEFQQEVYTKGTKHISADILKEKGSTSADVSNIGTEHDPMFHHQFPTPTTSASSFPETPQAFTQSSLGQTDDKKKDPIADWGKPLGLPAPAPPPTNNSNTVGEVLPNTNKGTPKKEKKVMQMKKTMMMNENNKAASGGGHTGKDGKSKRPESPIKQPSSERKGSSNKEGGRNVGGGKASGNPIYIDLTYVPHHGNSYYTTLEFFKKVRARYYVFSGTEPSREVYNALLDAKQTWEDKELEVTIIPTYDTDTLGYWVAENEDTLAKYKIDLSPSASRCTINLQDHETSCSAYRLEF